MLLMGVAWMVTLYIVAMSIRYAAFSLTPLKRFAKVGNLIREPAHHGRSDWLSSCCRFRRWQHAELPE